MKISIFSIVFLSTGLCLAADPTPTPELSQDLLDTVSEDGTMPTSEGKSASSSGPEVIRYFGAFRAKTMGVLPEGWEVVASEDASTSIIMPLELPNGRSGKFTIKPYVLVPVRGSGAYVVQEPGFDALKGLDQENTVGAVLTDFVEGQEKLNSRLEGMVSAMKAELEAARKSPKDDE